MTDRGNRLEVPVWDGSPENWETYQIKVGIFCRTEALWKQPQLIAKLINKLDGQAWRLIEQTEEVSLEGLNSKEVYLEFLKKNLLESAVPELGRLFRKWYAFKRTKRESMKLYVMRHRKVLRTLEKAMSQVEQTSDLKKKMEDLVQKERIKRLKALSSRLSTTSSRTTLSSKASSSGKTPTGKGRTWTRSQKDEDEADNYLEREKRRAKG